MVNLMGKDTWKLQHMNTKASLKEEKNMGMENCSGVQVKYTGVNFLKIKLPEKDKLVFRLPP